MEQGFPDVSSPDRQKQAQNSRAQLRLRNVKQTELSSSNHTRLINEKAQMGKLYYSRAGSSYFHFWWNSCGEPGVCAPSGGAKIYIARRNERFYQLKKSDGENDQLAYILYYFDSFCTSTSYMLTTSPWPLPNSRVCAVWLHLQTELCTISKTVNKNTPEIDRKADC